MIEIAFSSSFKRAFKRRIAGDVKYEEQFRTKLELFKNNPFEPKLKTHKLSGKIKDYSLVVSDAETPIIFYFAEKEKAVFVDIGAHKEVY